MALELPEIDARDYQALLDEARARIPVHNPEWLNYNDADPGITLLQLWAFMSENLLYQSKLIPERARIKFLKLLGIDLQPAKAAEGIVAFENLKGRLEPVTLRTDLEVLAGRIPFRTLNGLTVAPVEARPYLKKRVEIDPAARAEVDTQYALLYGSFQQPGESFEYYEASQVQWSATGATAVDLATTVDGALWLALLARSAIEVEPTREIIGGQVLTLGVVPGVTTDSKVLPAGGSEAAALGQSLEYHVPNADALLPDTPELRVAKYRPVQSSADRDLLLEPGVAQLQLPAADQLKLWPDLEPGESGVRGFPPALEGDAAERLITWIRIRPTATGSGNGNGNGNTADRPAGQSAATLSWVGANAALVQQRAHVPREVLGSGTGLPDQTYRVTNTPVLVDTVTLTVAGSPWQRVADLMDAGPEVPTTTTTTNGTASGALPVEVFRIDRESGEVTFGDGLHGGRPPAGASIVATYDYGGGRAGLVGISAISKAVALPAGAKVSNPLPTWSADEAQSIVEAERTISQFVRHRDRMVAADDFVEVVNATPGIDLGRVEILPLYHPDLPAVSSPGVVTLLLIPKYDSAQPDAPQPDQFFLQTVCAYVDSRRLVTTELHLRGPAYESVWMSVGIDVMPGRDIGPVREDVKAKLRVFLSPLLGGHSEAGWPLATPVNRLEALAVAARVDGVAKVFDVLLTDSSGVALESVPMQTQLHLPRLIGIEVRQGDPLPLADLLGETPEPDDSGALLPIPIVPEEC